ncbi:ribonuclease III [Muricomes sp. OA1]|uniref:Mini-ribonuclease 3 n=1 Tax=Hungatella hathewayi TaxID=154046 RepID=A0A3E2WJQ6_9FIRM|nr:MULTISPECIES: ribonuclease III domain-containing protein [Clostridia]MEE0201224.1 ribonuclease III domain-containing protein [Muricomes sp.]MCH1974265.1 ribonuclease III [Muricomes sp. OA1]MRM90297.1 ribonuclease III [Faecalicatena contorta]RGC27317.1 ribonuclease III [Hungatella hathewayi]GKH33040.1 mini-ribonuclease 3 [Faecalicatena contorta]
MEESINLDFHDYITEVLSLQEVDADSYSPLVLAFIGDCVYDLVIKSMIISRGNKQVHKLHEETSRFVQASTQSLMMRTMQQHLTEEEHAIYRRGRNAKSVSPAKNQSITDYRRATGFEALLGYLYLKKDYERLMALVKAGLDSLSEI